MAHLGRSNGGWYSDPPRCRFCAGKLEHCHGRYGDYMHAETRREHCEDGAHTADPERHDEMVSRQANDQREKKRRQRTMA